MSIVDAINAVVKPIAEAGPSEDGAPYATHSGELEILPGLVLRVYRLNDGRAIVDTESMARFLSHMGLAEAAGA